MYYTWAEKLMFLGFIALTVGYRVEWYRRHRRKPPPEEGAED